MPDSRRFALDPRTRVFDDGRVVAGGAPWRISRLSGIAADGLRRLADAGPDGVDAAALPDDVASVLVDRGLAHPLPAPRPARPGDLAVVVPAYGRADALARTLASLAGLDVTVVDDASPDPAPVAAAAAASGATLLRLDRNGGPAAARNAGLRAVDAAVVALVDSDCRPEPGWLEVLLPLFDDPRVAAVAPRVLPEDGPDGLLVRFERSASALDMGPHRALMRPGGRLGYLPSATLLVRREVVAALGFDEALRLGEDVDLVWRLAALGWHVRYEPSVVVRHEVRDTWAGWARRRFDYGTSAADLEERHPGLLTPLRASPWNVAALGLLAARRPALAVAAATIGAGVVGRRMQGAGVPAGPAARLVVTGLGLDAASVGHALRRELVPVTAAALALSPWSRTARGVVGLAVAPLLVDWVRRRPAVDPVRWTGIALLGDAAYGVGAVTGAVRRRSLAALTPRLAWRRGAAARHD